MKFKVTSELYPKYSLFQLVEDNTWKLVRKGRIKIEEKPNGETRSIFIPPINVKDGDSLMLSFNPFGNQGEILND